MALVRLMHFSPTTSKQSQRGSSLVEILVAVMVMATVLTAVMAGLTLSIKSTAESKYRSLATKRTQEALEMFRREHTILGWDAFHASLGTGTTLFCLPTLPAPATLLTADACDSGEPADVLVEANTNFIREATVDTSDPTKVLVTVTTTWQSGSHSRDVSLSQEFVRTQ